MAKTRSLPDKYYDKDYEHNGIHRVPLWRIACFALNNTATNLYMMMMGYATYYLMGWVGVGMMLASSLSMIMRIWDGVTDPFVGFMVDKTNGKFGKNRPFIVIGNIILAVTSFVLFHVTHLLPQAVRFPFYVVVLMIYYLGYTCQCVVTKSAQSCMTNDPKQRPMFASFDGVFNTVLFAGLAVVFANMANSYKDVGGYASTQFFHSLWVMTAIVSGIFTLLAVIAITPKDRPEFFGTGKYVPGLMGTLFSFVDKLVSSFAPMIAGVMFTICGFADHNPVEGDVATMKLRIGCAFCYSGVIMIGLLCNLIAMKFYPLTKEKMAEIQDEVAAIKMKAMAENA